MADEQELLLLFDGECNFCNGAVNFVIDHDPKGRFRFASLQSELGQRLVAQYALAPEMSSSILIERGKAYTSSTGALRAARHLRFPVSLLSVLLLVPRFARDLAYAWFAARRYRFFGKTELCRVPTPELRARFLG
ncbi:MAG TPA: DCC1-like thiol-disulfide oxidoreductase family protein [Polyangiales bacterium]|nr:DCC1-like thiol-disulfide oxidoreductase family protein [Polyangiales bacterium]